MLKKFLAGASLSMMVGLMAVSGLVQHASAACVPGTGVICAGDLTPIYDAGTDSFLGAVVSIFTKVWPLLIVIGIFLGGFFLLRRAFHSR